MDPVRTPPDASIAVVGMACRLPGADSPERLWTLLTAGRCSVTDVPADRFPIDEWHDPDPRPGAITSRRGGFLDRVREFDARFFSMSGREVERTDPRQRLLMETGWEAVADAGWPVERVAGSRLGVWVSGCMGAEYWDLLRNASSPDLHAVFGAGMFGTLPGRLSHLLDARGPSVAVDATCAGGLLAVHQAIASLRSGEAGTALVAGANLLLGPDNSAALSSGGVLSPEGLCRFGDSSAAGYVRSEGVVALVLKPLSAALADGDRVRAVLRGSGTGHDGRSADSQMTPSVDGQVDTLRSAYADAGVDPAEIAYVEAHGTGTTIGDRVELTALGSVLGRGRDADAPCTVGSVKSNVGHTEAVAGLTGLMKVVLALENDAIPETLHVDEPNAVFGEQTALRLAGAGARWPEGRRAVAGVSSFGINGANVHAVVERAPTPSLTRVAAGRDADRPVLVPLSAESRPALDALATQWGAVDADPIDLAHTSALHRTHHAVRTAALLADRAGAPDALRGALAHARDASQEPKVVFVFPGQGAQWAGMAADLLDANPVFARVLSECDTAIRRELGWSVVERLRRGEPLTAVEHVQPSLWAVAVGLAAVWRDWGVEPELMIGHSMGEVAAATASGALSIDDGAAVTCRRARLLADLDGGGAMALVQLGEDETREIVGAYAGRITISAFNSSWSSVIAGDVEAVEKVLAEVDATGVFCRRIAVDFASHSPHVDPVLEPLRDELSDVVPRAGSVPLHSTSLDEIVDGSACDGAYWADALRAPVRFASAVRTAVDDDRPTLFVEMSPHPVMVGSIVDELETAGADGTAVGSLHRDESWTVLLQAAGLAYGRGAALRWNRVNPVGRYHPLPTYPWQRQEYWPAAPVAEAPSPATPSTVDAAAAAEVPAPAAPVAPAPPELSGEVLERALTPDADGLVAAVLAGVAPLAPGSEVVLEQMRIAPSAPLSTDGLALRLRASGDGWDLEVGRDEPGPGGFVRRVPVATGRCRTVAPRGRGPVDVESVRSWCTPAEDRQGPLWRRDGEAVCAVGTGDGWFGPAVRALRAAAPGGAAGTDASVPGVIGELSRVPGEPAWCLARLSRPGALAGDVRILDAAGSVLADLRDVVLAPADAAPAGAGPSGAVAAPCATRDPVPATAPPSAAPALAAAAAPVAARGPAVATAATTAPGAAGGTARVGTASPGPGIRDALCSAVASVLRTPVDTVDTDVPLGRLGVDSLLASEIRALLGRDGIEVPTRSLLDGSGIASLARRIERAGGAAESGRERRTA